MQLSASPKRSRYKTFTLKSTTSFTRFPGPEISIAFTLIRRGVLATEGRVLKHSFNAGWRGLGMPGEVLLLSLTIRH